MMKTQIEYIEKLVELVSKNELTELSIEEGENAVIIRKEKEIITTQFAPAAVAAPVAAPAPQVAVAPQAKVEAPAAEAPKAKGTAITSPMVGTFYRSPSPSAPAFTEVGKTVNVGQVVCIIEAMKLMNEIESEVAGKVVEICVEDGQPVEYGQTLMIVAP